MAGRELYVISAQGLEASCSQKSRSEAVSTEASYSPSLKWPPLRIINHQQSSFIGRQSFNHPIRQTQRKRLTNPNPTDELHQPCREYRVAEALE